MASAGTPGSRGRQQETTPLASEKHEKPPLTRDGSVIQQVSNFIGISGKGDDVSSREEKVKWEKKRYRRIASKYKLKEESAENYVRNRSINQAPSIESATFLGAVPGSLDDVERGTQPAQISMRTPIGRAPIGPTPSLPNQSTSSSSFDKGRARADSFSQTADGSQNQSRLLKTSQQQRESVPSAVINSVSNFFKKGSFINKRRVKLHSSFVSKCSFDYDLGGISESFPDDGSISSSPIGHPPQETASPGGIAFETLGGPSKEYIEMDVMKKEARKSSPPEKPIIVTEIPEETSFEVEMEEMADIDEAQGGDIDPSAFDRMTKKVRKKSSIRAPIAKFPVTSSLSSSRSAPPPLQRGKTTLERPSNLEDGTQPILHASSSLPNRIGSSRQSTRKKSRKEDEVLEVLAEQSETKDREEGREAFMQASRMRSRKPFRPQLERTASLVDEVFFDSPHPHLRSLPPEIQGPAGMAPPAVDAYHPVASSPPTSASLKAGSSPYPFDTAIVSVQEPQIVGYRQAGHITYIDIGDSNLNRPQATALGGRIGPTASSKPDRILADQASTSSRGVLIRQHRVEPFDELQKKRERQTSAFTAKLNQGSSRQRGIGVLGKLLQRSYKPDISPLVKSILNEGEDERPWFTYWISTVQTVVCILSIVLYGFGPWGIGMREMKGDVIDTTLSYRRVSYMEQENVWLGPHYADIIRLGAVYSPCMRRENELWSVIEEERGIENKTGCCIANDHSGCYQSSELICPRNVARWVRWDKPDPTAAKRNFLLHKSKSDTDLLRGISQPKNSSTMKIWKQQRKSGAVCGQDPSYCDLPSSVAPHEWPDDITQWPICQQTHKGAGLPEHVTCQVTGRPCCIQLQGLCRIATKQYCDFVRGHWHENATLCSQVNCFSGVCGMIPFFGRNPNQFYRLFTSLFLHAGVFHFIPTLAFQLWYMKDLETLIGTKRMAILYFASGIGGNLASAIFVPFTPAVGPSSALCGIVAADIVDLYHHRHIIDDFKDAVLMEFILIFIILVIGLIPWIDNWAHLSGLIIGLTTTIIIFPYLSFDDEGEPPAQNVPTVPCTPNMPRGSMSTLNTAETPMMTTQGYSQVPNGPSPTDNSPTMVQQIQNCFSYVIRRFASRRRFYVFFSFVIVVFIFFILSFVFFANVSFSCPYCIHFNCLPIFPCQNQGQELKKWLPI